MKTLAAIVFYVASTVAFLVSFTEENGIVWILLGWLAWAIGSGFVLLGEED